MSTAHRTLPHGFEERLRADLGEDIAARLADALMNSAPATPAVRLNRRKGARPGSALGAPVVWSGGDGFYVSGERPVFAFDPAWHAGLYYVQDASSMALSAIVGEIAGRYYPGGKPLAYLDACAAPGGKTIAAIDALPPGSFVAANEFDRRRAEILVENLMKHGSPDTAVSRGDTAAMRRLPAMFDIIAVDAPCSGEGMMRKEPEAIAQWSPRLIDECAALQREIIANVWPALRPGGFLIYSTCTFNRAENEANLAWIEREFGASRIECEALAGVGGVVSLEKGAYRFLPGFVDGEGLFVGAVRKPCDSPDRAAAPRRKNKAKAKIDPAAAKFTDMVLGKDFRLMPQATPERPLRAVRAELADACALLESTLDLRTCGVKPGTLKGKDLAPSHALALSQALAADAFPRVELEDENAARAYLRGESLPALPEGTPRGLDIVTHGGAPLGFVKNLGNRANNLFPQGLRLKTLPAPGYTAPQLATLCPPSDSNPTSR